MVPKRSIGVTVALVILISDPQDKMHSGRELFSCCLDNGLFPSVISALRTNPVVQNR